MTLAHTDTTSWAHRLRFLAGPPAVRYRERPKRWTGRQALQGDLTASHVVSAAPARWGIEDPVALRRRRGRRALAFALLALAWAAAGATVWYGW